MKNENKKEKKSSNKNINQSNHNKKDQNQKLIIENTYKLSDESEIIGRKIINLILKNTIDKVRVHELENYAPEYTINKIFKLTTLFGVMGSLKPDIDNKDDLDKIFIDEVKSSKIDCLAANRTKIIKSAEKDFLNDYILNNENLKEDVKMFKPIIDKELEKEKKNKEKIKKEAMNHAKLTFGYHFTVKNKKLLPNIDDKLFKELKAQLLPSNSLNSKNKNIFNEVFNNLNTKTLEKNNSKLQNSFDEKININQTLHSNNRTNSNFHNKFSTLITNRYGNKLDGTEDFIEQFPLDYVPTEEVKDNEEVLIRESNLRIYFKEKEAERSKKNQEEKKAEKILKEESKKRKELIEEMAKKPFCFDTNGKIIYVVPPNPEKLQDFMKVESKIMRQVQREEKESPENDNLKDSNLVFEFEEEEDMIEMINKLNPKGKKLLGQNYTKNDLLYFIKKSVEQNNKGNDENNNNKNNKPNNNNNNLKEIMFTINEKKNTNSYNTTNFNRISKNTQDALNSSRYKDKNLKTNNKIYLTNDNNKNSIKNKRLETGSSSNKNINPKFNNIKKDLKKKFTGISNDRNNNILDEINEGNIQELNRKENENKKDLLSNISKITEVNEKSYDKYLDEKNKILEGKTSSKHTGSNISNDKSEESDIMSGSSMDTEKEKKQKLKFYQPNPLRSHEIPPGVSMEIYGIKKDGGVYPSIPNKLTFKEFNELLNFYRPTLKNKKLASVKELYKIYETQMNMLSDTNMDNSKFKKTLKNQIGYSYNSKIEEDLILKCSDFKEQLLVLEEELKNLKNSNATTNKNNPLKSSSKTRQKNINKVGKNKKDEIKVKTKNSIVKVFREFQYELIDEIDDEKIYEDFKIIQSKNLNLTKKNEEFLYKSYKNINKINSPVNKHVPYEKELGHMKKYPRERLSKEILAISGKISNENYPNLYRNLNSTNINFMKGSIINNSQLAKSNINNHSKDNLKIINGQNELKNDQKNSITTQNFYKNALKNKKN